MKDGTEWKNIFIVLITAALIICGGCCKCLFMKSLTFFEFVFFLLHGGGDCRLYTTSTLLLVLYFVSNEVCQIFVLSCSFIYMRQMMGGGGWEMLTVRIQHSHQTAHEGRQRLFQHISTDI